MFNQYLRSIGTSFLLAALTLAQSAMASGGDIGNGGNGVVFRDSSQNVQLLDFWEAGISGPTQDLPNGPLHIPSSSASVDEQIQGAVERLQLDAVYRSHFDDELKWVRSHFVPINPELALTPVPEVLPISRPAEGSIELMANYLPDGTILYNPELIKKLDNTHLAGLFVHEALYRLSRDFSNAENSVLVRKVTAYAFAEGDYSKEIQQLLKEVLSGKNIRLHHSDAATLSVKLELLNPSQPDFWNRTGVSSVSFGVRAYSSEEKMPTGAYELRGPHYREQWTPDLQSKEFAVTFSANQMKAGKTDIHIIGYTCLWASDTRVRVTLLENGIPITGTERVLGLRDMKRFFDLTFLELNYRIK